MIINKNKFDCALATNGLTIKDITKSTGVSTTTLSRLKKGGEVRQML